MAVERAAAADLDGVAEFVDVARLAEQAMVEFLAALGSPFQQLRRAVDGDALFVAGDEEGDRPLRPAAIGGEMVEHRGDHAGDAAFHVDGAAAIQHAAGEVAGKRRMRPRACLARRHHVGVAGEQRFGAALPMRA